MDEPEGPEEFFAGHPAAFAVFDRVRSILDEAGPHQVRTSKSQVCFRRGRGFAFLWLPGRYLRGDVMDRPIVSARFKEVVQPAPGHWMHHLEVRDPGEIDDEVATWLRDAADRAGPQMTSK